MGKYEDAEIQFEQALKIAPHDPEIKFNQAEMLMLTNRGEEALKNLEETLKFYPDHIKTLYKLVAFIQNLRIQRSDRKVSNI